MKEARLIHLHTHGLHNSQQFSKLNRDEYIDVSHSLPGHKRCGVLNCGALSLVSAVHVTERKTFSDREIIWMKLESV